MLTSTGGIIPLHDRAVHSHPHPHLHPNWGDISVLRHPNTYPKIVSCVGSHLRGDNNDYNEWLHVDILLERVAVDLRVMSARDVELDRVRVLVAAIDSRKYRRRSRAHSLDTHAQREVTVKPVRRSVSARATTNRLRELTHALMDNNRLTRSASLVIINNANNTVTVPQKSESTVTTLPRSGRADARASFRSMRQRSFEEHNMRGDISETEKKPIKCSQNPNRFSLDVETTGGLAFQCTQRSPTQSRRRRRLRGPYGEMLENRMEEMRKGGERTSAQRLDLTFLQELLDETRQQREQLDLAAIESCGQRNTLASSHSLEDDTNTNSGHCQDNQQGSFSAPDLIVKESWDQPVVYSQTNSITSPSITADIKRHLDTRTHVVGELYDTEKSYVESLRILVERYMIPLKSQMSQLIDDPLVVDTIFYRIPEILRHHETFLELLRHRITNWNAQQTIGDLISNLFTSEHNIADTYTAFINNWSTAKETIRSAEQTKSAFSRFLENTSREHSKKLTLDALLIQPVQRIPRYELLVRELLKHTHDSHPDKQLLLDAQKHVHELALKINQMESETSTNISEQQRVKDIEMNIEGVGQLSSPNRTFIRFDIVSDAMSKKQRALFIFSDLLVVASIKRKSGANARKISSSPLIMEAHKYKCFLKVSLDAVHINNISNNGDSRDFAETLQTDLNTLNQISEMSSHLSCPHQNLEDVIRDLSNHIQRQIAERTHTDSHIELVISNQDNSVLNLLFATVERRMCWESAFNAAKQALASDRRPAPEFISPPIAIRKTRAGLQFTCASAVGGDEVWVCNSDGFVGQVCILALQSDGATVTSCNGVCNARINCLTCVPAQTQEPPRDSESSESEEEPTTMMATMWLGTEDGIIHIYHSGDNIRIKKNRIKIQLNAAVNAILYHNDKVFAAMANAQMAVFTRDPNGQWNIEPQLMSTETTVTKMIVVAGKLWSVSENCIKVSDFEFNVEHCIDLDSKVLCMVASPSGVSVACHNSHTVRLIHATTFTLITTIDISNSVIRVLSHQDAIIRQHKSACLRVTTLLHVNDTLFVGTSGGVIVTIRDCCPSGLLHGHTGHVRFLTSVETDDSRVLVISGGDGFEDFSIGNHNHEGRDDSTNHLLIWQIL